MSGLNPPAVCSTTIVLAATCLVVSFSANKTALLKPLKLSEKEMDDLVAFLEAFSGPEIKVEAPKLPDYAPLPAPASN